MSLKKLSLAAALSIGILTINGIANAAGCDVCPQQTLIPQEPCPITQPCPTGAACPVGQDPTCPNPCVSMQNPITGTCSNCHPNATILKRQAFAFPNIGSSSVVVPSTTRLVQVGGEQEVIVASGSYPSGLTAAPETGQALTVYPKEFTGAASPLSPICPTQIMQGTDVLRCNIPNSTKILQSQYCDPCANNPAMPVSTCPVCPSGGAAPVLNDDCGCAVPMSSSCGCPTGAAAQLKGNPRTIQTASGIEVEKTVYEQVSIPCPTGAACPVDNQYPDVSNNMFAGCDINKLTVAGALAGYPDRTYKPNLPIIRSELASAMVGSLELENVPAFDQQIFKDVPTDHWANADIDKAYNRGILAGYPNDTFKPNETVTRAEALSAMAKVIPGDMSTCDAQNVLKSYSDANELPGWAAIPVAEALNAGLTKDLPDSMHIRPNDTANRAEIASMLKQLRIKLCLDPAESQITGAACALQPKVVSTTIPTLKVKMDDIVTARTSVVGDGFGAKTTEPVTIDGQFFPAGSKVTGKVVEVIRPGFGDHGGIRLQFDRIEYENCKASLPKEILSATVIKEKNANIVGRIVAWPFTWTGKVVGVAGRTVSGSTLVASNMLEGILTNTGNGTNELFNAKFRAAGRSYLSAGRELGVGIFDTGKTLISGTTGVLKETGDELAYIVAPDGSRIAQVNPREQISIAFGCK